MSGAWALSTTPKTRACRGVSRSSSCSQELAGDPEASRRLQREAETIALLNHPNICTIFEIDEHEGSRFIAMERVDGTNLKLHMSRTTLSDGEIVDIAKQIAGGARGGAREGRSCTATSSRATSWSAPAAW